MKEIKVIPAETYDMIYACVLRPEQIYLCEKIEEALGYELFQWQKLFLFYRKNFTGRRLGKTTISCIKTLLTYSIIDCRYTYGNHSKLYIKELKEMQKILRKAGLRTGVVISSHKEEREFLTRKLTEIVIPEMAEEMIAVVVLPAKIPDGDILHNTMKSISVIGQDEF